MRRTIALCLCVTFLAAGAQKRNLATLRIIHPARLSYDTLLVKANNNDILSPLSKSNEAGTIVEAYSIPMQKTAESSFSIYFGGCPTAVSDSLYFLGFGNNLQIEINDSFALRDNINLKLKNVFNFEELYSRYVDYYNSQMRKVENISKYDLREYSLRTKFDFVKKNLGNHYVIDLFSFFVIDPKDYPNYEAVKQFYQKNLKDRIKSTEIKNLIESRIEHLRQSLNAGSKAPSFSAYSIKNQVINNEALLGKTVLLTFWATWCSPCIKELPALKAISEEYKEDSLIIVGVSLDHDSLKMVNLIRDKNLDWVHIFNSNSMLDVFRINPIPAMFLINEKGVIIYSSAQREEETSEITILRRVLRQKFMH